MPAPTTEDLSGYREQFLDRRKLFSDEQDLTAVAAELQQHLEHDDQEAFLTLATLMLGFLH